MNQFEDLNFGIALKAERNKKQISQEELADSCELDRTYISLLERNKKNPTINTLIKLSRALAISPIELLAKAFNRELISGSSKKEKIKLPFFGTAVSCGLPINEDYSVEKQLSLDESFIKNPKKTFFIKATGDSMTPTIFHGDLLIIEQVEKSSNGNVVLVQIGNEFTVKRYFKNGKQIRLMPDNLTHKEIVLSEDISVTICGIVTGIARTL